MLSKMPTLHDSWISKLPSSWSNVPMGAASFPGRHIRWIKIDPKMMWYMCIAVMFFLLSMFDVADEDLIGLRRFPSLRLTGKRPQRRLILHNPSPRIKKVCAGSWSKLCFWLFFSFFFWRGVRSSNKGESLWFSAGHFLPQFITCHWR